MDDALTNAMEVVRRSAGGAAGNDAAEAQLAKSQASSSGPEVSDAAAMLIKRLGMKRFQRLAANSPNIVIPVDRIEQVIREREEAAASRPPPLMLTHKANIQAAVQKWQKHPNDVGSSEVQIAVAHERIKYLTAHMLANKHDQGTKRGLQALVTLRRINLNYLHRTDPAKAKTMAEALGIRFRPPGQPWDRAAKYSAFKNTKNEKAEAKKLAKSRARQGLTGAPAAKAVKVQTR